MHAIALVREFIVDTFLFGNGDKLRDEASLVRERIVDSTGMLELVSFLEERFGLVIDDEELIPENLDSLRNIERFLGKKLAQGAGEPAVSGDCFTPPVGNPSAVVDGARG
jgi:acyl carrier protein